MATNDLFDLFDDADFPWLDDAACADLDISEFFVEAGHTISPRTLDVCRACPVRKPCIEHAYRHESKTIGGYYGGLSPSQRKRLPLEEALRIADRESRG